MKSISNQNGKIYRMLRVAFGVSLYVMVLSINGTYAWSDHPLLVRPALESHPVWDTAGKVEAIPLRSFLILAERHLEGFLATHEEWSVRNLPHYARCPEVLMFKATGNPDDILSRFFSAIRINPDVKIPLYLHLPPGAEMKGLNTADPRELTTLKNTGHMAAATYIHIPEGYPADPFEVLCTASDEPDYGFDLGLFEDNNTPYGRQYGFGLQPFGNPNLEYGSQAPFHMGFYHENKIIYRFGPFLRQTYLDYRIFLYKALSEFAFSVDQPYWGWRFMGWGMHYAGDVSMPYHMKPLPGVSTLRMLWINLKAMLGAPKSRNDAVQIVSNRHTVWEEFQVQELRSAYLSGYASHPFIKALKNPVPYQPFSYRFLINEAARESAGAAGEADRVVKRNFPAAMVSDPEVEVSDLPGLDRLTFAVRSGKGDRAHENITLLVAERMRSFSMHVRSYMDSIIGPPRGI